jgi:Pyruvate/2-oxoacid:ferredoxin oxidoreductase delta subunit
VPGLRKAEYHKLAPRPDDFAHMLSELYLLVKPKIRFTLIDGVIGMEGNGPSSGEIRKLNILIAGEDAVAVDTMATHFLGFAPEKLEMMRYLARKNAGETNRSKIEIVGDRSVLQPLADFKFPSNWYMNLVPRFMVRMLGKFVWMKPVIDSDRCENCLLCANSCPVNAITVTGTSMPLVSQNDCISCLCCHELCPYHAIELKSSFLARRLIRH